MGTVLDEEGRKEGAGYVKCCKNCRHFCPYIYEFDTDAPNDQLVSDYGECRRFPPRVVPAEEQAFPIVEEHMWCGEFDF